MSAPTPATWGALFDWDGVIIHSAFAHEESWVQLAAEHGRTLPEGFFLKSFGMKNAQIIPTLLGWSDDEEKVKEISLRKEVLYRAVVKERGIEALLGVREFLSRLQQAGVPCVIASSTDRLNITTTLETLGLAHHFAAIVSSEDVKLGKPHPDVFLKAAVRAGHPPERCVVFEDAMVGIEAGKAGGMKVIGVTTTHPVEKLHEADFVVDRLDELTATGIAERFGW